MTAVSTKQALKACARIVAEVRSEPPSGARLSDAGVAAHGVLMRRLRHEASITIGGPRPTHADALRALDDLQGELVGVAGDADEVWRDYDEVRDYFWSAVVLNQAQSCESDADDAARVQFARGCGEHSRDLDGGRAAGGATAASQAPGARRAPFARAGTCANGIVGDDRRQNLRAGSNVEEEDEVDTGEDVDENGARRGRQMRRAGDGGAGDSPPSTSTIARGRGVGGIDSRRPGAGSRQSGAAADRASALGGGLARPRDDGVGGAVARSLRDQRDQEGDGASQASRAPRSRSRETAERPRGRGSTRSDQGGRSGSAPGGSAGAAARASNEGRSGGAQIMRPVERAFHLMSSGEMRRDGRLVRYKWTEASDPTAPLTSTMVPAWDAFIGDETGGYRSVRNTAIVYANEAELRREVTTARGGDESLVSCRPVDARALGARRNAGASELTPGACASLVGRRGPVDLAQTASIPPPSGRAPPESHPTSHPPTSQHQTSAFERSPLSPIGSNTAASADERAVDVAKKQKRKKKTPHEISAIVGRVHNGRAPATALVVVAAEIVPTGDDARGIPLTRKLASDVKGIQNAVTEIWHDDARSRSLVDVLALIDDSKLKMSGAGAMSCRADVVVVTGHGALGHLVNTAGVGQWPLDEVAREISARLPNLGALVLAACACDEHPTITSSLSALARERDLVIVGMRGSIDTDERDRIVRYLVDRAVHADAKVVVGDAVRSAVSMLERDQRRIVVVF